MQSILHIFLQIYSYMLMDFHSNAILNLQEENKEELFEFLADGIPLVDIPDDKVLMATRKDTVVSSSNLPSTHLLSPCTHEEADTRGMVHLKDMVCHGHSVISMRTVDSDWVVISLANFHCLTSELKELYVEFGTGNHYR